MIEVPLSNLEVGLLLSELYDTSSHISFTMITINPVNLPIGSRFDPVLSGPVILLKITSELSIKIVEGE